jgi:formamidopyrimidine-DNA glycosylase
MPELPDVELYRVRLEERLVGRRLEELRPFNPFVLRSFDPPPSALAGKAVVAVSRLGKRLLLEFEEELFAIIHLMIAGRLRWAEGEREAKRSMGKIAIAEFRFEQGALTLVEVSSKKRASIHLVAGRAGLDVHRRKGLNVLDATPEEFRERLRAQRGTLKRVLANPDAFDGIGNAFSDEILFAARLSPVRRVDALSEEEETRLQEAMVQTLRHWIAELQRQIPHFPKPNEVTAFRPDFAVHGRFNAPCLVCGSPVQRIAYAENEANYCALCQNEGRLLADRSLSRLLRDDWPRTLEQMLGER